MMTDINSLVKPGSTNLYLVFGNDINSRGEIAFAAIDQNNGDGHAAMAIPCDEAHADTKPVVAILKPHPLPPSGPESPSRRTFASNFKSDSAWAASDLGQ